MSQAEYNATREVWFEAIDAWKAGEITPAHLQMLSRYNTFDPATQIAMKTALEQAKQEVKLEAKQTLERDRLAKDREVPTKREMEAEAGGGDSTPPASPTQGGLEL